MGLAVLGRALAGVAHPREALGQRVLPAGPPSSRARRRAGRAPVRQFPLRHRRRARAPGAHGPRIPAAGRGRRWRRAARGGGFVIAIRVCRRWARRVRSGRGSSSGGASGSAMGVPVGVRVRAGASAAAAMTLLGVAIGRVGECAFLGVGVRFGLGFRLGLRGSGSGLAASGGAGLRCGPRSLGPGASFRPLVRLPVGPARRPTTSSAAAAPASSSGSWPNVSGPKAIPHRRRTAPWRSSPVRTAARRETFLRRHRGETGGLEAVALGEAPRLVERLARHHGEFHAVGLEGAPVVDQLGHRVGRHAFQPFLDPVGGHSGSSVGAVSEV
jgi:hypothetical protein